MVSHRLLVLGIFVLLVCLLPDAVLAQGAADKGYMNQAVEMYREKALSYVAVVLSASIDLFWMIALIEFSWQVIRIVAAGPTIEAIVEMLIKQIIYIAFFYWLLVNSQSIAFSIVESFQQVASASSGGVVVSPTSLWEMAINYGIAVIEETSAFSPIDTLGLWIAGVVVVSVFALACLIMVLVYLQMYITTVIGMFLLALAATPYFKSMAINFYRHIFATGMKLFTLNMVATISIKLLDDWLSATDTGDFNVMVTIMLAIFTLGMFHAVPRMVEALILGVGLDEGLAVSRAANQIANAVTATAVSVTGAAVGGAMLGKALGQASGGDKGQMMQQVAGAAKDALKSTFAGRTGAGVASSFYASMNNRASQATARNNERTQSTSDSSTNNRY